MKKGAMMRATKRATMKVTMRATIRASQFAKSAQNLAPQVSFASFFKVIFRSGLLFLIGSGFEVPVFD